MTVPVLIASKIAQLALEHQVVIVYLASAT